MATVTPIRPRSIRISREQGARLYTLEEARNKALEACALEWARVMGHDPADRKAFWETYLPQALYDLADSYDRNSVKAALTAYLEDQYGAKIEFPA